MEVEAPEVRWDLGPDPLVWRAALFLSVVLAGAGTDFLVTRAFAGWPSSAALISASLAVSLGILILAVFLVLWPSPAAVGVSREGVLIEARNVLNWAILPGRRGWRWHDVHGSGRRLRLSRPGHAVPTFLLLSRTQEQLVAKHRPSAPLA